MTIDREVQIEPDTKRTSAENLVKVRTLYPILARRNLSVELVTNLAAQSVSQDARVLSNDAQSSISMMVSLLLVAFVLAIVMAILVGRAIEGPLRLLERQARRLIHGRESYEPLVVRGPRELAVTALAVNELTSALIVVEEQAHALASGQLDHPSLLQQVLSKLGASVQEAVRRLSDSIQAGNELRDRFAHAAAHDPLTGLPNRLTIRSLLDDLLASQESFGLLFVDLDHFKEVNDQTGHHGGDQVLCTMAQRFAECCEPLDVVGRMSGDEFVVVSPGSSDEVRLATLADRITEAAALPVVVDGLVLCLTASVGVAPKDQIRRRKSWRGRIVASTRPRPRDETSSSCRVRRPELGCLNRAV